MRTDFTETFGSVALRAVVSVDVLMEVHDRFGTLAQISERVTALDVRIIVPVLEAMVRAGQRPAQEVPEAVKGAIEEAGLVRIANWVAFLFSHACDKAARYAGEQPGTETANPTPD